MGAASQGGKVRTESAGRRRLWNVVLALPVAAGGLLAGGCVGPGVHFRQPAPAPTPAPMAATLPSPYGLLTHAPRTGDARVLAATPPAAGPHSPYHLITPPRPAPLVLPPVTLTGLPPAVLPESLRKGDPALERAPATAGGQPGAELGPPPREVEGNAPAGSVPQNLAPDLPAARAPACPRVDPASSAAEEAHRAPATPVEKGAGPGAAEKEAAGKDGPNAPAKNAEIEVFVLPVTPVPAPAQSYLIDLGTVWRLAGADNPTIGLAEEAVREALARELGARALLLPNLTVGGNYHNHQGVLQASPGFIRNVDSQSFYYGAGARTLAGESVAFPGVRLFAHLGDAYYEPLAARQEVTVRQFAAKGVRNEVLLEVTAAYLDLIRAEAELEIVQDGERDLAEVTRITESFARTGQGRAADANRARTELDLLRGRAQQLEGEVGLAAARLAGLLSLDPSVRLHTAGAVRPVHFMDTDEPLDQLVQQAIANRPEVAARTAAVAEAETRVRQERVRPFLPLLSVGYSAGDFGGGSNLLLYRSGHFNARSDFDVFAVWTLQNAGLGNHAQAERRRAEAGQEVALRAEMINRVRREVAEARATIETARARLASADRQRQVAELGFAEERARIRGAAGRPIEVLDSFHLSLEGRIEYLEAAVAYDLAQFRLFVALGNAPTHREGEGEAL